MNIRLPCRFQALTAFLLVLALLLTASPSSAARDRQTPTNLRVASMTASLSTCAGAFC